MYGDAPVAGAVEGKAMKHGPLLVFVLLLAFGGQGGARAPLLAPAGVSPFDLGAAPGQVVLADLKLDGHLDLLTRHQQARAIRIHLGDGQASFTTSSAAVALAFSPGDMRLGRSTATGSSISLSRRRTATSSTSCWAAPEPSSCVPKAHPSRPASAATRTTSAACIFSTSTRTDTSTSSQPIGAGNSRFPSCWETGADDLRGGPC
jgi:hypothetical protein